MNGTATNPKLGLHIGGKEPKEGWLILDAIPGSHVDIVGDAANLNAFADGYFDSIYASHVLEHFDYVDKLLKTLVEWKRVIRPGGLAMISVPDLKILCSLMLDTDTLQPQDRFMVMRMMFGGHINKYDYHMVGLNDEFLASYLHRAGFVNIQRVNSFGLFRDTSEMIFKGRKISLNMLAQKPNIE